MEKLEAYISNDFSKHGYGYSEIPGNIEQLFVFIG